MVSGLIRNCAAFLLWFVAAMTVGLLPSQVPPNGVRLDSTVHQGGLSIGRHGDTVHVVGTDSNFPTSLRYARSSDGGRTWPIRERVLIQGSSLLMVVAEDRVFVGYQDGGVSFLLASFDGGTTWQQPLQLPVGIQLQRIHAVGTDVSVFFIGGFLNSRGVFQLRSVDGGVSWYSPVDLAIGLPTGSNVGEQGLQIVEDGPELHLFWTHFTPQSFLAHQRSFDGGATWLPNAQVIANATCVAAAFGAGRLLVQASSTLWTSSNHGVTWSPLAGHGFAFPVALVMDGNEVLAVESVWTGSGQQLRTATSNDAGLTWSVSATAMAIPAGSVTAAVVGDARFVRYKGGGLVSALYQSDDRGATWRQIDGEVSAGFLPGRDGCIVLTEGLSFIGLWAWVLEGHTGYSMGNAGTGGVVPNLTGRGLAGLGRTFYLHLERALGGTLAGYVFGFGATAATLIGPNTRLLVAQPIGPLFVMTSGASGQAGTGTATFAAPVPNDPSCVGLRLLSQAFVVDPGAPDGFCATAARESWIR